MLTISAAGRRFPTGTEALRGVSLRVARGSIVALLGANGAGKTTTLKAISRLVEAERGEVTHGEWERVQHGYLWVAT